MKRYNARGSKKGHASVRTRRRETATTAQRLWQGLLHAFTSLTMFYLAGNVKKKLTKLHLSQTFTSICKNDFTLGRCRKGSANVLPMSVNPTNIFLLPCVCEILLCNVQSLQVSIIYLALDPLFVLIFISYLYTYFMTELIIFSFLPQAADSFAIKKNQQHWYEAIFQKVYKQITHSFWSMNHNTFRENYSARHKFPCLVLFKLLYKHDALQQQNQSHVYQ